MCNTHDTRFSSPNVSLSHERLALIHWSSLPSRWSFIICSCVPVKMMRIALVWFLPTLRCKPTWSIRYWIASVLLATPCGNFISSRFRCVRFALALSGTYVLPFVSFLSIWHDIPLSLPLPRCRWHTAYWILLILICYLVKRLFYKMPLQ